MIPIGTPVRRKDSEYAFHGVIVAAFTKLDGKSVRYVVEGAQEGNRGMLLIMSEKNLEKLP